MYRLAQMRLSKQVKIELLVALEVEGDHLVQVELDRVVQVELVEVHVLVVDEQVELDRHVVVDVQVELGRLVQHGLVEVEVEVEVEHDGQVVVLVQVRHLVLASSVAPDLALFSMPTIAFASCPCSSSSRPPSQA